MVAMLKKQFKIWKAELMDDNFEEENEKIVSNFIII